MEITARGLWTIVHGMGFGALYLSGIGPISAAALTLLVLALLLTFPPIGDLF